MRRLIPSKPWSHTSSLCICRYTNLRSTLWWDCWRAQIAHFCDEPHNQKIRLNRFLYRFGGHNNSGTSTAIIHRRPGRVLDLSESSANHLGPKMYWNQWAILRSSWQRRPRRSKKRWIFYFKKRGHKMIFRYYLLFLNHNVVFTTQWLLFLSINALRTANGDEGGSQTSQTCVSTYAQATCMGPWFGWNETSHLNQGWFVDVANFEKQFLIASLFKVGMVAHWIGFLSLFGATIGLGLMSWYEKGPG